MKSHRLRKSKDGSLTTFTLLPNPPYILYYKETIVIHKVQGIVPQIQSIRGMVPKARGPNNEEPIEIQKLLEKKRWLAIQKDNRWYLRDTLLVPNIQHFVKTLGIRAKTIYKLCDTGAVNSIADLYRIPWIRFHVCLGVKLHSPIVEKIRTNIQQTKVAPWPLFLQALNIPGITSKNRQKLVEIIPNLSILLVPNQRLLEQHFNAKFVKNLMHWVHENQNLLKELMALGIGSD